MKLFDSFKANKKPLEQTAFVKVYSVKCEEKEYTVVIPKKTANKQTVLHFENDTVFWEQLPLFWRLAGRRDADRITIYRFDKKLTNTLFVVKGAPFCDHGLDNGIFRKFKKCDNLLNH